MNTTHSCEHCHDVVTPVRPSRLWWLGVAALALGLLPACVVTVFLPPVNVVLVPVLFFIVAPIASLLGEKLQAAPTCPSCGERMILSAPAAELPRRPSRPSHERAMKRALV